MPRSNAVYLNVSRSSSKPSCLDSTNSFLKTFSRYSMRLNWSCWSVECQKLMSMTGSVHGLPWVRYGRQCDSNGSGGASAVGHLTASLVSCNLWQALRKVSSIHVETLTHAHFSNSCIPIDGFRDLQGSDGPQRFIIEKSGGPFQLPKVIHPSTASTCRPIRMMRAWKRSWC